MGDLDGLKCVYALKLANERQPAHIVSSNWYVQPKFSNAMSVSLVMRESLQESIFRHSKLCQLCW
jgi:hypothetical protein